MVMIFPPDHSVEINLPDPLVSSDIDIRGFSGFILDVNRLLASELVALGTPEECWAAVMLWCRAWQQQPPSSLPNDDALLAAFSGAGRKWTKVKRLAMRDFVLCSDNRWYHPVIADEAKAVWEKRKAYKNDQDRLRKWRDNKKPTGEGNMPSTLAKSAEKAGETQIETRFNGVSEAFHEAGETRFNGVSETPEEEFQTRFKSVSETRREPYIVQVQVQEQSKLSKQVARASPLEGITPEPGSGRSTVNGWYLDTTRDRVFEAAAIDPARWTGNIQPLITWLNADIEPDTIVCAIKKSAARGDYKVPYSLAYFDNPVRAEHGTVPIGKHSCDMVRRTR